MATKEIVQLSVTLGLASLMLAGPRAQAPPQTSLPEVLKTAMAYYATLTSYADRGTLTLDTGGDVRASRFTTYFRRGTRDLLFDFQTLSTTTVKTKFQIDHPNSRTVLWMFNNAMQKYDFQTRAHEIIPSETGGQVRGLQSISHFTSGASIMITSLLYSKAQLPSAILQIERAELTGVEEINHRRCHKVAGTAAAYYPSGRRTGIRPVTVWIDTETQLIRRVLEDTPEGYGGGKGVLRLTFDYEPQANPAIDDSTFQFTAPAKP